MHLGHNDGTKECEQRNHVSMRGIRTFLVQKVKGTAIPIFAEYCGNL